MSSIRTAVARRITSAAYVHPVLAASHDFVRHVVIQFAFEELSKHEPKLVTHSNTPT
jgi:hypothetical protein